MWTPRCGRDETITNSNDNTNELFLRRAVLRLLFRLIAEYRGSPPRTVTSVVSPCPRMFLNNHSVLSTLHFSWPCSLIIIIVIITRSYAKLYSIIICHSCALYTSAFVVCEIISSFGALGKFVVSYCSTRTYLRWIVCVRMHMRVWAFTANTIRPI